MELLTEPGAWKDYVHSLPDARRLGTDARYRGQVGGLFDAQVELGRLQHVPEKVSECSSSDETVCRFFESPAKEANEFVGGLPGVASCVEGAATANAATPAPLPPTHRGAVTLAGCAGGAALFREGYSGPLPPVYTP